MSDDCPDPAALLAEAEGYGLDSTREHLRTCEDCRRLVEDLRDWPDINPALGVREMTKEEERESWERFLLRVEKLETN